MDNNYNILMEMKNQTKEPTVSYRTEHNSVVYRILTSKLPTIELKKYELFTSNKVIAPV